MNKRICYERNDLGLSFATVTLATVLYGLAASVVAQIFRLQEQYWWTIVQYALNTLVIGASALAYAALTKADFVKATTLNKKPLLAHVGWGVLATAFLIVMMVPLNEWIMQGIVKLGLKKPSVDIELDIYSMIIVVCILPAFTEEIVFRGTVAQSLAQSKNKLASLTVVGGLFALFHMNPAQTVHQFVLGAFMALLVFRSGSVWTSVIVHLFNNLTVVILDLVGADAFFEANAIWLFFVGLLGFAGAVVGYLFTTKSKWGKDCADGNEGQAQSTVASNVCLGVAAGICGVLWILTLLVAE